MKVVFFHLMPYADLPDDFQQRHRSVWVDVDPKLYDPYKGRRMYLDYLDELEFAAEVGFDGIGVNEHHANGYGLMPSPNLMAATLARNTTDAAIVVLGDSIALYNPPIRVAEEIAMLDVISGGRMVAGFPVGTPMDTCFVYGVDPATLRDRYQEAHDLIVRAWSADAPFAFNGRYTQLRTVNCWPRPIQQPRPPIWVPGGGSVETWEWCAATDYVYCYLSYFGYKLGRPQMQGFWDHVDTLGLDPNPYRTGFAQFVAVADSDAEARELYAGPAEYFYGRSLFVHGGYVEPPGYKTEATIRAGVVSQMDLAAQSSDHASARRVKEAQVQWQKGSKSGLAQVTFDDIVDKGYIIVGTPTTVAERLHEMALDLRVGHLVLLPHFGNMSKEVCTYNTRLLGEKVLPEIQDLFDDEWEDHWWPSGATRRVNEPGGVGR